MKKALIVGINNYPSCPLEGCVNDAKSIAEIIETNGDASRNFTVKLEENVPNKAKLRELIDLLFSGDCETALFYFSGHGFLNEKGGYIVMPDFQKYDEGVSMDEILLSANSSKCKNKIIILDCCHSGAFGSPQHTGGNYANIGEGVTILTASRKNESAIEINGHGVFTNLLIDALKGGAADLQGHITPGSIYAYIDQALGVWEQRPVFKTNITQFTSIRMVTPRLSIDKLRKIIDYFPEPLDFFNLNPSFEDTNCEEIDHVLVKPYAEKKNVEIFKVLQKFQSVGLVIPVDEDYMYFAAMNSKSCKLTELGHHYWRLVNDKRI